LGLDWKQLYLAVTEELGAKNIKLHTQWGASFDDIDWQIKQAEKNNAKIIYVLGLKTGRWPECHMPEWAKTLEEKSQKTEILKHITETVMRYKDSKAIEYWQVENEPLFKFGQCPNWYYKNDGFLKTEVALVKSLDPSREVIILLMSISV
jgi:endo-1,4-beta-mannosidase